MTTSEIAIWFSEKYRARMREVGLQAVCAQLKKQGVTPEVAAHLLFGRPREPSMADLQRHAYERMQNRAWHGGLGRANGLASTITVEGCTFKPVGDARLAGCKIQ